MKRAAALGWLGLSLVTMGACAPSAGRPPLSSAPPPPRESPGTSAPAQQAPDATRAAIERSIHVALGIPEDGDPSDDVLIDRDVFVASYNPRLNTPNWVAWNLDQRYLGTSSRSAGFHSDDGLPKSLYVVRDQDYVDSGYDRGHLCPSADRTHDSAMNKSTFILSNVEPQLHELNAGPWERLEAHERELARQGKELFIVAGGLFDREPPRIGKQSVLEHRVAVPRASYKIVVVLERGGGLAEVGPTTQVIATLMPNQREAKLHEWDDYLVTVRAIEQASGYDFLSRVPKSVQDAIELSVAARSVAK